MSRTIFKMRSAKPSDVRHDQCHGMSRVRKKTISLVQVKVEAQAQRTKYTLLSGNFSLSLSSLLLAVAALVGHVEHPTG